MLQLDAMTLRGIGSYARGSRLEIRPLTILCGTNGSGKSTWFKTLNMLKRSLGKRNFPFKLDTDDSIAFDVGFMNFSLYCSDNFKTLDHSEEEQFGPPACIGLEFTARETFQLGRPEKFQRELTYSDEKFLFEGKCEKGMKLRIRIAHPTNNDNGQLEKTISHLVELRVDGSRLRFLKLHNHNGHNDKPAQYEFDGHLRNYGAVSNGVFRRLARQRLVEVLKHFFSGYFYISAVRQPYLKTEVKTKHASPTPKISREVGSNGENWPQVFCDNSTPEFSSEDHRLLHVEYGGEFAKEVITEINNLLEVTFDESSDMEKSELARFWNKFLGGQQPPGQFSSGFHQLALLIVQLAIMKAGELLAVENPEVHLHPNLQLKVSQYLLSQVPTGRRIMIETHSDLIIRRVVRAILAEEVPQQNISLNFCTDKPCKLHTDSDDETPTSVLEPFRVDPQSGEIQWPQGFMDESINESQRLLDIMYGKRDEQTEESE